MNVAIARRVLWISLLLLIPLPFFLSHWAWVPAARVVQLMLHNLMLWVAQSGIDGAIDVSLLLLLQLLLWSLLLWGIAWAYGAWSARWPAKIRGSVMGLAVLSVLVVFSSMPIYRPLQSAELVLVSFLQVYY